MFKVLKTDQTTGDVFDHSDVPSSFAVIAVKPSAATFPTSLFLEYAVAVIDGEPVADADLIWRKRHGTTLSDDAANNNGNTLTLINNMDGVKYRVVASTAGVEVVIGQVF